MKTEPRLNRKFQNWYSRGLIVHALSGEDAFFIPDPTYRDNHAYLLALRQLLYWAEGGREVEAAKGFQEAIEALVRTDRLHEALLLLRSYHIVADGEEIGLPLHLPDVFRTIAKGAIRLARELSQNEELRALLLLEAGRYPQLAALLQLDASDPA
jgi:hypothetical protein